MLLQQSLEENNLVRRYCYFPSANYSSLHSSDDNPQQTSSYPPKLDRHSQGQSHYIHGWQDCQSILSESQMLF